VGPKISLKMLIFFFSKYNLHLDVYDLDLNGFQGFWPRAIFLSKKFAYIRKSIFILFRVKIFFKKFNNKRVGRKKSKKSEFYHFWLYDHDLTTPAGFTTIIYTIDNYLLKSFVFIFFVYQLFNFIYFFTIQFYLYLSKVPNPDKLFLLHFDGEFYSD